MYTNTNFTFFNGTSTANIQNYHFLKISLKILMCMWFAIKRRSCSQKTKLLNSEISVLFDMIDQWPYDLHPKTDSLQNRPPQANNSSAMEKLTIDIPTPNRQTFTVYNWYLPSENSLHLKRTGISLSELQPETKVHEVICADVNAQDIT